MCVVVVVLRVQLAPCGCVVVVRVAVVLHALLVLAWACVALLFFVRA